jgi:hypothetical protein
VSDITRKEFCCALAERLGPRVAGLDDELRSPGHRSFRKLGVEYDVAHVAIKRHKDGCLGLRGQATTPEDLPGEAPTVRMKPAKQDRETGCNSAETAGLEPPRARGLMRLDAPKNHEEKVLAVVSRIADGTWNGQVDIPYFAREWGCSADALRHVVREAFMVANVDRGTVDQRRQVGMGKWDAQVALVDDAIRKGPEFPDTMSKLIAERARGVDGWCKAAGVYEDSTKIQVNVTVHPVFTGTVESILLALRDEPIALAKVRAAIATKLSVLQQTAPPMLTSIETEGTAVE